MDSLRRVACGEGSIVSPSDKFDRYMIALGAARHVKFRRLTVPERHAFFLGVLSVAAQAPIRGCLLVGDLQAEAADVAAEADVPEKVATSAMEKLRLVGVIYTDDDLGCERVHDFDDWNPAPKRDATAAERMQRYRDRKKARNADAVTEPVTAPVTRNGRNGDAPEVEVEEKTPPTPQGGHVVTFRRRRVPADQLATAERALAAFNQQTSQHIGAYRSDGRPSDALTRILGAITDKPEKLTGDYCERLVTTTLNRRWWGNDPATVGVIFGPGVIDRNIAAVDGTGVRSLSSVELGERLRGGAA